MSEHINNFLEEFKDFNKELEEKILEANNDPTKVKWNKLLPQLMAADVFIAAIRSEKDDGQMNILMLTKGSHAIVPFFTSSMRLAVMENSQLSHFDIMRVNTAKLFVSIAGRPCVMNPFSEYTHLFRRSI